MVEAAFDSHESFIHGTERVIHVSAEICQIGCGRVFGNPDTNYKGDTDEQPHQSQDEREQSHDAFAGSHGPSPELRLCSEIGRFGKLNRIKWPLGTPESFVGRAVPAQPDLPFIHTNSESAETQVVISNRYHESDQAGVDCLLHNDQAWDMTLSWERA